ncbi:MAG: acylphosphatase [Actinomycetota bacterium]
MPVVRAHVLVSGYVHGVFFRHSMCQRARALGITGWVRNTADGRVEAVAEGAETDVKDLVAWCRCGPPHATVQDVEVSWESPSQEFSGFSTI